MVRETKKAFVQELAQLIRNYHLVGLVNLQNLPAPQLQRMRSLLVKNEIKLVMARKKVLELALDQANKENLLQLKEKIKGMPALLFSQGNPFALYKFIQNNKSKAPAKAGQTAPRDIVVKAGPTNFVPGPIISELAAVGIKTKVDAGKLAIINDVVVAKENEVISAKVAETLKRLDINPMEVGLQLVAVWENGLVFEAKQLHLDEAEYQNQLTLAAQWALNLAIEVAYTSPETIELLLQKAFREARALSLEQKIITDLTTEEIISQVEREATSLMQVAVQHLPEKNESKVEPEVISNNGSKINPENQIDTELKTNTNNETKTIINQTEQQPTTEVKNMTELSKKQNMGIKNEEIISHENIKNKIEQNKNEDNHTSEEIGNDNNSAKKMAQRIMGKAFNKDNQTIRVQRVTLQKISAEKLVEEELMIAKQEQLKQAEKNKKDASIKQAEELYQKLKKVGTLRE